VGIIDIVKKNLLYRADSKFGQLKTIIESTQNAQRETNPAAQDLLNKQIASYLQTDITS
jgi:hypothetical protein